MALSPLSLVPRAGHTTARGAELTVRADRRLGWVDITEDVRALVRESGIREGCCVIFCGHTTCGLLINEWEEGVQEDLERSLDALFPVDSYYAHDDMSRRTRNLQESERANGHSHLAQMVAGSTSQTLAVTEGEPWLGRWQRLCLLELDEPRERALFVQVLGV